MLFTRKTAELPTPETALKGRPDALPTAATHFVFFGAGAWIHAARMQQ